MSEILQLLKDNNEIVIMIVGIFLIVVGIVIFITGRYSDNENHVEGFGIKMDVKNPSLILIVFGIFLLVFPMMNNIKEKDTSTQSKAQETLSTESKHEDAPKPKTIVEKEIKQLSKQVTKPEIKSKLSSFSIEGDYSLSAYVQDTIPYYITGQLHIESAEHDQYHYPFSVDYQSVDQWNNNIFMTYSGYFIKRDNQWYLKVTTSNNPQWRDLGEVPTQLIYDKPSQMLGLEYYYDAQVASVWSKVR